MSPGDEKPLTPGEKRERLLGFYLSLSSPTRVCVIDALKGWGALSERELGEALVDAGDIPEQAKPNLGRLHLSHLVNAKLIKKFVDDSDGEVRYREGPAMKDGVYWSGIDRDDEEVAGAAYEFARVLTERRTRRQTFWERMRWDWPGWTDQGISIDSVVRCTHDDINWYDEKVQELDEEFARRIDERRAKEGTEGEWPYFRTLVMIPMGNPSRPRKTPYRS